MKIVNFKLKKEGILIILLIITLLPFCILSFYNHAYSLDYWYTGLTLEHGFFAVQKIMYMTCQGRYFSDALLCLNPLVFGAYWAIKLNTFILLILLVISTYWLCGKIFIHSAINTKLAITSLFIFSFLLLMPDIEQGIFWINGTYQCLVSEIMSFFLFGCMISYYSSPHKKLFFILSLILAIAIIGCYEIQMLYIDFIIFLFTLICMVKKQKLRFPVTLLSVCVIFSLIEIIAPGNRVRAGTFCPSAFNVPYSLKESVINSAAFLIPWLPFMFFTCLLLVDLVYDKNMESNLFNYTPNMHPILIFIACLALPLAGFFLLFLSEADVPPLRTVNAIYFYFISGMFYFSFSFIALLKKKYPAFHLPLLIKLLLYVALFGILFLRTNTVDKNKEYKVWARVFRTNNITAAYTDISSGCAAAYNREMKQLNENLANCKADSCFIEPIKDIPVSFYFYESPQNGSSQAWLTSAMFREYCHKKYIGIKGTK